MLFDCVWFVVRFSFVESQWLTMFVVVSLGFVSLGLVLSVLFLDNDFFFVWYMLMCVSTNRA